MRTHQCNLFSDFQLVICTYLKDSLAATVKDTQCTAGRVPAQALGFFGEYIKFRGLGLMSGYRVQALLLCRGCR